MNSTLPDLSGKVALIVGANGGIGTATALAFAKAGAQVAIAARNARGLARVAEQIRAVGGDAHTVMTDVTDPTSVERLVSSTLDKFGRLDVAFNNAAGGGHPPTPLVDVAIDDFDSALDVNLRGTFLSMKYEIPAILREGGGAIVNMASTAGLQAVGGLAGYVASKWGVIGLTKVAALDYARKGIRVNAVAPGPILTERLAQTSPETRQKAGMAMPMGRVGLSDEVAAAVVWLCSEGSSFITGAVVPIDGGKLAGTPPFKIEPQADQRDVGA